SASLCRLSQCTTGLWLLAYRWATLASTCFTARTVTRPLHLGAGGSILWQLSSLLHSPTATRVAPWCGRRACEAADCEDGGRRGAERSELGRYDLRRRLRSPTRHSSCERLRRLRRWPLWRRQGRGRGVGGRAPRGRRRFLLGLV